MKKHKTQLVSQLISPPSTGAAAALTRAALSVCSFPSPTQAPPLRCFGERCVDYFLWRTQLTANHKHRPHTSFLQVPTYWKWLLNCVFMAASYHFNLYCTPLCPPVIHLLHTGYYIHIFLQPYVRKKHNFTTHLDELPNATPSWSRRIS